MDTKQFYIQFGQFIREGRLKKDLYQREVADLIGLTQSHYSGIESGRRHVPMKTAMDICRILSLDFNDFLVSLNKKKTI